MKKIMETLKWIMFIVGMIMAVAIVRGISAAEKPEWKAVATGTILDVDPVAISGSSGLFYEIGTCWVWIWAIEGPWPARGQTGTFYKLESGGDKKYKWVKSKGKSTKPSVRKVTVKKVVVPQVIIRSVSWKSVKIGIPSVDRTVLVRYKNGKTITTAYLNAKKEWKLETDRKRVSGGRRIETIKEWKEIPI